MLTLRTLWLALFASTFLYLVVLFVVPASAPAPDLALLGLILGAVALGNASASIVLPGFLYRSALSRETWATREVAAADASIIRGKPTSTVRVLDDPADALARARARFMTPFILGMALAESVAIFGLVLGLLGFAWASVLPFFVGCWLLFVWHFPREAKITGPVERAASARFTTAGR